MRRIEGIHTHSLTLASLAKQAMFYFCSYLLGGVVQQRVQDIALWFAWSACIHPPLDIHFFPEPRVSDVIDDTRGERTLNTSQ